MRQSRSRYDKKNALGYPYASAEKETAGARIGGLPTAPTEGELRLAALQRARQLASPLINSPAFHWRLVWCGPARRAWAERPREWIAKVKK